MLKLGRILAAQQIIFGILVFLIPTQFGYHIFIASSYLLGIRVDYLAPTIYFTDLLVITLFGLYILERFVTKKTLVDTKYFIVIFLLSVLALLNVVFAASPEAAFVKWVKIFELALFVLYIKAQKNIRLKNSFFLPLTLSGILFSAVGIAQFVSQKTLGGIFYFLGERTFSSATPGIALGDYFGFFGLRAYSTFSHPNSFAAFLGFLLISLYFFQPKNKFVGALRWISLFLAAFGLYVTLSRWIFVSLVLVFLAVFLRKRGLFDFGKSGFLFVVLAVTLSLLLPIFSNEILPTKVSFAETFFERLYLAKRVGEVVVKNPLLGIGLNNYIISLPREGVPTFVWKLQPVHNIFLLVFAEGGMVGLLGLTFVIWKGLDNSKRFLAGESAFVFWVLLFIVLSGLADHYWFTLQQNQLILVASLGFSLRKA